MISFEGYDGERYRFCTFCGADCELEPENQNHSKDCPQATNLWPVTKQELEMCDLGCFGCGHEFIEGEVYYMHTDEDQDEEILCLSCGAHERLLKDV